MVVAALLSGSTNERLGIYESLFQAFELDVLSGIRSRVDFQQKFLPTVAQTSREFAVLGSEYFDTGLSGTVQLIGRMTSFSAPRYLLELLYSHSLFGQMF